MTLLPTWDLFIIIFAILIVAYSFIVGRDRTVKIIIGTYIAILSADGIGNLLFNHLLGPDATVPLFNFSLGSSYIILIKIICFVSLIVILTLKGAFEADVNDFDGHIASIAISSLYGLLSAGLIVSAILVYVSGGSFITAFLTDIVPQPSELAHSIYDQSIIAKAMIDNSALIFALPAVTFIISSFTFGEGQPAPE